MILTKEQQAQKYAEKIAGNTCMAPVIAETWLAGYTAAEQSMWRSVEEELPEDGDYLTLIRYDSRLIMEIAPWRGGLYQGGYTLSAYTMKASVTHWMPTPILPKLPDTNTEKK